MANTDENRWRQRLENYRRALLQLQAACQLDSYTDLERAGLAQTFEFTFELAWKTLKDRLFYEGFEVESPREAIRKAVEAGYLTEDDGEALLDALEKRNLLSHTYLEKTAREAEMLIKTRFWPALTRLGAALEEKALS